ncbi:hypothetical protein EV356DRAFT_548988 [Viridothelium virens]|uniref:NAD(P)-binding protein n=1 Tax=Viridothelium virens TaxID=1048519 RepID=A0A6A6H5S6_VIRVR|nr:hypothetical protein EV356DRAFT_548988 [Viridothelium virens]
MSAIDRKFYLVTEARKGIGRALVATFLARSGVTVVAAVRNGSNDLLQEASDLPKGEYSELITVHIDSTSASDALKAATLPLLDQAQNPRFVAIGSAIGSIGGIEKRPFPMFAYGISKALAHFITDMGNTGAKKFGIAQAPVMIEASASFIVKTIDEATRNATSGHFPSIEGDDCEW